MPIARRNTKDLLVFVCSSRRYDDIGGVGAKKSDLERSNVPRTRERRNGLETPFFFIFGGGERGGRNVVSRSAKCPDTGQFIGAGSRR